MNVVGVKKLISLTICSMLISIGGGSSLRCIFHLPSFFVQQGPSSWRSSSPRQLRSCQVVSGVCSWEEYYLFVHKYTLVPNNSGLGFLVGHVRWKFLLWVTGFPIFGVWWITNVVTYGELMVFWSWLMEGFRLILWLCAFSRLAAVLGSLVEAVVWGVFFIFPLSSCNKAHPAGVTRHRVS